MIESPVVVRSERFGEHPVEAHDVFRMTLPMPGFEKSQHFALLKIEEFQPVSWFQSMEEPNVCVALIDPWPHFPAYKPVFAETSLTNLQVGENDEIAVFCVVAPHRDGLSINLAAPIVLHARVGLAEQVILQDESLDMALPLESSC